MAMSAIGRQCQMIAPIQRFSVVANELLDPPYPQDTKANGWSPTFEIDRISSSDTWVLADDDERPWLLRIWYEAWKSVPVGSMPSDRRLFARRVGCKVQFLDAHAEIFMRGWVLHSDGNLYHPFIVGQVEAMLATRSKNREKIAKWREEKANKAKRNQLQEECNQLLTSNQPVSNHHGQDRTGQELDKDANASLSTTVADAPSDRPAVCPHLDIIDLYHDTLPELPGVVRSRWSGSADAEALRQRWRESPRHQSLDFWQRFFLAVRENPHWMGENDRHWQANLRWLVKRANFDKVIERMVTARRRQEAAHG
jgi:hypothetical protein